MKIDKVLFQKTNDNEATLTITGDDKLLEQLGILALSKKEVTTTTKKEILKDNQKELSVNDVLFFNDVEKGIPNLIKNGEYFKIDKIRHRQIYLKSIENDIFVVPDIVVYYMKPVLSEKDWSVIVDRYKLATQLGIKYDNKTNFRNKIVLNKNDNQYYKVIADYGDASLKIQKIDNSNVVIQSWCDKLVGFKGE